MEGNGAVMSNRNDHPDGSSFELLCPHCMGTLEFWFVQIGSVVQHADCGGWLEVVPPYDEQEQQSLPAQEEDVSGYSREIDVAPRQLPQRSQPSTDASPSPATSGGKTETHRRPVPPKTKFTQPIPSSSFAAEALRRFDKELPSGPSSGIVRRYRKSDGPDGESNAGDDALQQGADDATATGATSADSQDSWFQTPAEPESSGHSTIARDDPSGEADSGGDSGGDSGAGSAPHSPSSTANNLKSQPHALPPSHSPLDSPSDAPRPVADAPVPDRDHGFAAKASSKDLKRQFKSRLWSGAVRSQEVDPMTDVRALMAREVKQLQQRSIQGTWEDSRGDAGPVSSSPASVERTESPYTAGFFRAQMVAFRRSLAIAGIVAMVSIGAFLYTKLSRDSITGSVQVLTSSSSPLEGAFQGMHPSRMEYGIPLPPKRIAEAFLAATTVQDRAIFVRAPEQMLPLMHQFYASEAALRLPKAGEIRPFRTVQIGQLHYDAFVAGRASESRLLCVVDSPEGWLVDWEAYSRASSEPFEGLLAGDLQETGGVFRVLIEPADYYNFQFTRDTWSSFRITNPDLPVSLTGYAWTGSRQENAISKLRNSASKGPVRCILRLNCNKEMADHRQAEIMEFVQIGWVTEVAGIASPVPTKNLPSFTPKTEPPTPDENKAGKSF
ncbi:MAG: hypothetical protein ACI9R3_005043 [Verrucomicrobiales bacterium]|jgi:hypothetical protein